MWVEGWLLGLDGGGGGKDEGVSGFGTGKAEDV